MFVMSYADSSEEIELVIKCVDVGAHHGEFVVLLGTVGYLAELQRIPGMFLSVSLEEVTAEDATAPPEKRAAAETNVKRTIDRFLTETGWHPLHVAAVAGALMFSKYNFITRFVMKRIAEKAGKPVDTTRDYEFTDWTKLDRLIEELVRSIPIEVEEGV